MGGENIKKYEKETAQSELNNEKAVLKKLQQNYKESLDEINAKIEILLAREDADMAHVIYQVDYQRALKKQVEAILDTLQNNEFETISEYLTQSYNDGFLGTLYAMQAQGVPFAFPINQELVVAAIQHETMLTSSLYVSLGLEIKQLQKEIAAEISRGVTNQMGYSDIARNIANRSQIPLNKAMTIARTESHRIRETAASHVQDKAVKAGADVVKIWDAALDGKTRPHHRELDGQIREVDEPFEVAGLKAMRPGQFGIPAEDINCRCRSRCEARWALNDGDTKMLGDVSKMDDKTKKEIAKKLGIPEDELEQYSNQIVPIKAKNYEDFKQQYNKLWRYDDSVRENVQKINSPINARNTSVGKPSAIAQYDIELNKRQKSLLDSLKGYDSSTIVKKNKVKMTDLSALTAKTGDEFAMFTNGNERLIIRGNSRSVNVTLDKAKELSENGYKWSGHTHPGYDLNCLIASPGDYAILKAFRQETGVTYNSLGRYLTFNAE